MEGFRLVGIRRRLPETGTNILLFLFGKIKRFSWKIKKVKINSKFILSCVCQNWCYAYNYMLILRDNNERILYDFVFVCFGILIDIPIWPYKHLYKERVLFRKKYSKVSSISQGGVFFNPFVCKTFSAETSILSSSGQFFFLLINWNVCQISLVTVLASLMTLQLLQILHHLQDL